MEFFTDIKGGRMQTNVVKQIQSVLHSFEGKRISIKLDKIKSSRSHQQNKYYWVCVTILSQEIGYEKNELHEILKYKFLTKEKVDEKTGECYNFVGSTTKLNKTEFGEFVAELQRWSSQTFNVVLPDPNEQVMLDL